MITSLTRWKQAIITHNIETKKHGFNVHGSVHLNNILIYIQQDAMLHSLFYMESALHVSEGITAHH
jgi:predicted P-loop ATPase